MKGILAVLLVVCMIFVTPAYAAVALSEDQSFDPLNVKGKGIDVDAANELINENNIENINETSNNTTGTLYTDEERLNVDITDDNSTNDTINNTEDLNSSETPVQKNSTETTNDTQPVSNLDNNTNNTEPSSANETITAPVLNTTGIVMQTTNYTCGPAALATVLNNMGINATEQELATLAGTDENGTTMYGLIQAAKSKGLNARGMKISINDLKKNNVVFLTINGNTHYSVIKEVTNESVFIADPSLGNTEMTLEDFIKSYSGYALILTDNNTNESNGTNNVSENNSVENIDLTDEELLNIKGMKHLEWVDGYWSWKPGYFSWVPGYWAWHSGWWEYNMGYLYWVSGHWERWWIFWYWVPGHLAWHSGFWDYHQGYWYWIHGHWKWNPGRWIWNSGYWKYVSDWTDYMGYGNYQTYISKISSSAKVGGGLLTILTFINDMGYKRATHGKYSGMDGQIWVMEIVTDQDVNDDGWVGPPDDSGLNAGGYRTNKIHDS